MICDFGCVMYDKGGVMCLTVCLMCNVYFVICDVLKVVIYVHQLFPLFCSAVV